MQPTPEQLNTYRKQLAFFMAFTDEEWAIFAERLYIKRLHKKDHFVNIGKVSNEIGFILNGSVRLFFIKDGQEISNFFCFEHELVTSYKSFLRREPSVVCLEAMEDTVLICFTHKDTAELIEDTRIAQKMERFWRLINEYLVCCYEDRMLSFIGDMPEERYQKLLASSTNILQRIPQHYIANYLGVTPVSLSRIRKRISDNKGIRRLPV